MSKTIIEVKCIDQVLTLTNTPVIASGGVGEDYVSVEFCDKWKDYWPTLVFWRKGVDPVVVLDDEETGLYQVPPQLMTTDGIIFFGVVGHHREDGDIRRTSEAISYRLEAGAINENTILPTPTGEVFDQLMSYYAENKLYVANRVKAAEIAAGEAGYSAMEAMNAAERAAEAAEKADPVAVVNGVIYPGVVDGYLPETGSIGVTLDRAPSDKMILTFRAPLNDGTMETLSVNAVKVAYPDDDGKEKTEFFMLRDGYQSAPLWGAIGFGDVVTAVLIRVPNNEAYIVNPRITHAVMDEMNQRFYPGTPASKTTDGTMTVSLNYVPEDKMVLVFAADEASSQVTKFQLEYETVEDGVIQEEYFLVDANGSTVEEYGFYQGDYVVALLTPGDKQVTVLNPRVTRDTLDLIRGMLDNIPQSSGGCETVTYTGSGEMSIYLSFSASPKVIHIDSLANGGYNVSVTLYRDEQVAKLRVFSDGDYWENVVSTVGGVTWGKSVLLLLSDYWISPNQLNVNNTKYIATGIM
jgi:hypothetical protein